MADDEYTLQERRVWLSEQREARFQRAQEHRERSSGGGWSPSRAANRVTQRSGTYSGKGMLAALLLAGFVIVAIRLVADYELQDDGSAKGTVMHPQGQYGPLAICAGLIGSFFLLSLLAMGGGTRAKLAVLMGSAIILTLGVKSYGEITHVGTTFGSIGKIAVPPPSGNLPDIYGNSGGTGGALGAGLNAGSTAAQATNINNPNLGVPASPVSIHGLIQDAVNALGEIIPGQPGIVGTFKNGLSDLLKGLHL